MHTIKISIIIACYNEEDVVAICHEKVCDAIKDLKYDFEIVYIDDGSRDNTYELLKKLQTADQRMTLIELSRNFGKEAAITAGLDHVNCDAAILLDADLQDPPSLIPEMIKVWEDTGADVVYGQRLVREGETWLKKITANNFYRVINYLLSERVEIPKDTGDFRLMNRRAIEALRLLGERTRFMKGLFAWIGYKQVAFKYNRAPRTAGETKWNYSQLSDFAIEGITSFSTKPLRFSSLCGIAVSIFAFIFGIYTIIMTLVTGADTPGWASLVVITTFIGGVQLLSIGILGEYVGRIFRETKQRPIYFASEVLSAESHDQIAKIAPKAANIEV